MLADLEYFERLLKYKKIVDQALNDHMFNIALERKEEEFDLSLEEVFDEDDFDYEKLIHQFEQEDKG